MKKNTETKEIKPIKLNKNQEMNINVLAEIAELYNDAESKSRRAIYLLGMTDIEKASFDEMEHTANKLNKLKEDAVTMVGDIILNRCLDVDVY